MEAEIKKLARQNKLLIGLNSVTRGLSGKSIEAIWICSTLQEKTKGNISRYASIANVPVNQLGITGEELGILCKKQFSISAVAKVKDQLRAVYDSSVLELITLFESMTGARIKDCIRDNNTTFIVEKGSMGLAIGRNGGNMKRVERAIRRPVRIVEFDDDVTRFAANLLHPLRKIEARLEGRKLVIRGEDMKTRAMIIGRERSNLNRLAAIVKRHFDIEGISVI